MRTIDKETIVNLAQNYFNAGHFDNKIKIVLQTDKLKEEDVSYLLKYVSYCQKINLNSNKVELSIKEMKAIIFKLIGTDSNSSWDSTLSKSDVKAIYNFIISLPSNCFKELNSSC